MKILTKVLGVPLLAVLTLLIGAPATNADTIPYAISPVIDSADIFSAEEENELAEVIEAYHEEFGLVFAVETIPSLDGQKLEEVSLAHANELGVGNADSDNGVFILLSRDDREVRFELGEGVNGKVTDSEMGQIISNDVTPHFKDGDYFGGLENGMNSVGMEFTGVTAPVADSTEKLYDPLAFVGLFIGGLLVLALLVVGVTLLVKFVKKRKEEKAKQRKNELLKKVQTFASTLRYDQLRNDYKALPNEKARFAWLEKNYPDVSDALKELKHGTRTTPVDRGFLHSLTDMPYHRIFAAQAPDTSVRQFALLGTGFENISLDEANKRISTAKLRHEKVMAKRLKEEAKSRKEKQSAKEVWRKIPKATRVALKKAKSQSERERIVSGTEYGSDFAIYYPILSSMYLASSSSSGGSSYGSSSSSSSSSSSGGYGGYDSGGGSYGGGSFDGGGSSGSW